MTDREVALSGISVRCSARKPELLPHYASADAAGADLKADLEAPVVLTPGKRLRVGTGLRIELPKGFEAQVRPRSGLAHRHGITLLNSPGTIDSDYRGEVSVILVNLGDEPYEILPAERIAQLVIAPVARAQFVVSADLETTDRGEDGFGSTGR